MASENPRAPRHEVATLSEHRELQRSSPGAFLVPDLRFPQANSPNEGER